MDDRQVRDYGLFLHLSALSWIIGIPGFIGPLVMWLVQKDASPFIDRHGKAAVNFQISLVIYVVVLVVAGFVFIIATLGLGALVFFPLFLVVMALAIVFPILAGLRAQKGEEYTYPLAIPFIK